MRCMRGSGKEYVDMSALDEWSRWMSGETVGVTG